MFEDLQRLFKESVAAFRAELEKREPEDEVAHLLGSMRRELVEAKALVPRIEEDLKGARAELAREQEQLQKAERRGKLAANINDAETVRIAEEFATKHRERVTVLEQKVAAREAELGLRRREAEEMMRQYQEADANRMELVARLRRTHSHDRIRSVADEAVHSFSEYDRMARKMGAEADYLDALRELDEDGAPPPPRGPSPTDIDARLEELKRRMGKG